MISNGKKTAAPSQTPAGRVGGGFAGLLNDVMMLAELQIKLLSVDAKEATGRMIMPLGLLAAGAVLALTAIPLALIAIAQVLRYQAGWPPAVATLAALLLGLVIAGILGYLGYRGLLRCTRPLARSRDEFNRNVDWLKGALKRHDHRHVPATPPIRGDHPG